MTPTKGAWRNHWIRITSWFILQLHCLASHHSPGPRGPARRFHIHLYEARLARLQGNIVGQYWLLRWETSTTSSWGAHKIAYSLILTRFPRLFAFHCTLDLVLLLFNFAHVCFYGQNHFPWALRPCLSVPALLLTPRSRRVMKQFRYFCKVLRVTWCVWDIWEESGRATLLNWYHWREGARRGIDVEWWLIVCNFPLQVPYSTVDWLAGRSAEFHEKFYSRIGTRDSFCLGSRSPFYILLVASDRHILWQGLQMQLNSRFLASMLLVASYTSCTCSRAYVRG